ncbi:MAG: BREX system Lon protease-like protein BrxL [Clostridiales bacterium]|nr:BREX system Lon protease-like protein BrxL [Clostridiales bacterium]
MTDKLRDCFEEMVVYKDLKNNNFVSALGLPSFLRDWLLKKFADDEGNLDMEEITDFVHTYLPNKEEWLKIKDRIIYDNERVQILTKISVDISIKTGEITFELPDFGLTNKETIIEASTWEEYRDELVSDREVWGVAELGYRPPDDSAKPKIPGKIRLTAFTNFCPYTIDLDYYKDVRNDFTVFEWIDVLLGAIDYNAAGYKSEEQKLYMLTRLLPFVEKNLNLIELAPKGTGKSYVFGHISKYGLLTDGGKVTRTKMFYDKQRKAPGFIVGNDFVVIDEVKLVQFGDVNEMRSAMQGYMQYGKTNVDGYDVKSDAGIVFLGNIEQDNMDEYKDMFSELPSLFRESALMDRIHGFIKGWEIPRMNDDLKMSGWALNSEYFCTILHELRSDFSYRAIVDQIVIVPQGADTRHTDAVKKIATAYLKLLFPNVRTAKDVDLRDFNRYCLRPAVRMRSIILRQLRIRDKQYKSKDHDMPSFSLREVFDED